MSAVKNLILEDRQVRQKIRRMAYAIYENNFSEKEIVLAGIVGQGYSLAQLLETELSTISPLKVKTLKVNLSKEAPEKKEPALEAEPESIKKKVVILVDDVLNSGRTLAYAMKPFLTVDLKKIEVAVLVNRSHPKFPVQPNYTGYELSTTLSEHVEVVLGKKSAVYLH
ncbi:MAG TPA: phosphoribosyltransferase family protein [Cyclobacteriaceae bacterium]|nr:phosphoribosyltransferase family protein [Cyclobacteriaceae bacterium]